MTHSELKLSCSSWLLIILMLWYPVRDISSFTGSSITPAEATPFPYKTLSQPTPAPWDDKWGDNNTAEIQWHVSQHVTCGSPLCLAPALTGYENIISPLWISSHHLKWSCTWPRLPSRQVALFFSDLENGAGRQRKGDRRRREERWINKWFDTSIIKSELSEAGLSSLKPQQTPSVI